MSSQVLDVLSYAKTLEVYKNHKPVFSLGGTIFEEYYDYYIKDGLLFVVGTTAVSDLEIKAMYTVSIVNPVYVKSIHIYKDINPVIEDIPSLNMKSKFESVVKTVCEGLSKGENNFGICTDCAVFNIEDVIGNVNDTFKTSGNLFSVETIMQDSRKFDKMMTSDGSILSKKTLFSSFDMIESLYIPLHKLFSTPFANIVPDEIKELCNNYTKSIGIHNGTPYKHNKSYHKGERVKARVDNKGTIEYRYYVSKIGCNSDSPLDSDNWLEITDSVVEG
jgi:hypothetical protein